MPGSAPSLLTRAVWTAQVAPLALAQRRFPFRSGEAISRAQSRRVRKAVSHAYAHVPYYRETMRRLGLGPGDIRGAADLARLPLIEREQVQRDPEYFVSTDRPIESLIPRRTGGSSGQPITIFNDPAEQFLSVAYGERFRSLVHRLTGRKLRYRQAAILLEHGAGEEVHRARRQGSLIPFQLLMERRFLPLNAPLAETLDELNRFQPDVLVCSGSSLEALFSHVISTGAFLHRPKVAVYSSDSLAERMRRVISERFGIQVLSLYLAAEGGQIGFECDRHTGHHVNSDLCPVRIVDPEGRDLPVGESGEVVVSDLRARGSVLLNYRIGDLASDAGEGCPCGRNLPLLSLLEGRTEEWLVTPAGGKVNSRAIRVVFAEEPDVWRYQVVQEAPERLSAAVVTSPGTDHGELRARIASRLADLLEGAVVEVSFVDSLPRTPRGKVKPVISLVESAPREAWTPNPK